MGEWGADRPDVVAADRRPPILGTDAGPGRDPQAAPSVHDGQGAGPAERRVVPLGATSAGRPIHPSDAAPTYLRFEGILDEDLHFQRAPGYEVETPQPVVPPSDAPPSDAPPSDAPQPTAADGPFEVVLLDADDQILAQVRPAVDFTSMPVEVSGGPRVAHVRADVPFGEAAAALEFRAHGHVLHRDHIPSRPPTLQHVVVAPDDGQTPTEPPHLTPTDFATSTTGRGRTGRDGDRLRVEWQASSPVGEDVTVDVLLRDGDGREQAFARGLTSGCYVTDVSSVRAQDVTLVVRATDGVRSTEHLAALHLDPVPP